MHRLSVVMITHNAEELLERSLRSIQSIADEIVVVDYQSKDRTMEICKAHNVRIFFARSNHLGKNKARAIKEATNNLILSLDSDEIVSAKLAAQIVRLKRSGKLENSYRIPYRNHLFGRRLRYGGENYRMVRLFQKRYARMTQSSVHEYVKVTARKIGELSGAIEHYSYRSTTQIFQKFTRYALLEAEELHRKGEQSSVKKIFLYPVHMFWARHIKDRGYKDGGSRIVLDLGFAYMEWLTYTSLALRRLRV